MRDLSTEANTPTLYRSARDDKYYFNRYGSSQTTFNKNSKIEARPEARTTDTGNNVEKRCSRCTGYNDPYDYRVQDRTYDDRDRYYYDRYDDHNDYYRDRYDRYDNRYDRYERDRWYDRRYDDRYDYRGYDYRDRYDRYDNRGTGYDNRGYDTKNYDYRGTGYDNRGYDYRRGYDNRVYRPWDENAKGNNHWDSLSRGYYGSGRPDWGLGYDRGYASGWNYGGRGDGNRDNW